MSNKQPIFVNTYQTKSTLVDTANSGLDGSGAFAEIANCTADTGLITRVHFHALGATTAGMLRLFYTFSGVSALLAEIPVTAITPGFSTPAWSAVYDFDGRGFYLANGGVVALSTEKGELFSAVAEFGVM